MTFDWDRPFNTKLGFPAERLDDDYVWEKGLRVNLVKVYGGGHNGSDVLLPYTNEGKYAKALEGQTDNDLVNEPEKKTLWIAYVNVKGAGETPIIYASGDIVANGIHAVKVEVPISEMAAPDFYNSYGGRK